MTGTDATTTPAAPARRRPVVLIVVVALIVAGVLAWLFWSGSSSTPVSAQTTSGPYTVRLTGEQPRIGGNGFTLEVTGPGADAVTVEPVMPQMGHALTPVPAAADGPGRYRADVGLPMAGQWELTVSLRGPAGPANVVFPLLVK
ncbi:FixH family protein [Amycolatopsis sp. NPDC059021]|uniref:FixH family protein n=1 Tax=Amycolatopsis sp. NPDC059021 TaxID=3346704 RepID=UPI00366E9951